MKKRNTRGFTMAELLIVVAIIAILSGVVFVAVQNYQRDMAQLERDTIAKELFIAAQNHLTMAESQGYMGLNIENPTAKSSWDSDGGKNIYYVIDGDGSSALDIMLPFGAIDETVRGGGSYVIRYQANPALVLDVFYCPATGQYAHSLGSDEYSYSNLMTKARGDDKKSARLNYASRKSVIGWYGGGEAVEAGNYDLQAPEIRVTNAERLSVAVTNTNNGNDAAELTLIIEGASGAKKAMHLTGMNDPNRVSLFNGVYTVILDDITSGERQFAKLEADNPAGSLEKKEFLPGEDITVSAVAFSNSVLSNIAYSASITVNSLFADVTQPGGAGDDASDGEDDDINAASLGGGALMAPDGTPVEDGSPDEDDGDASEGNTAMIANFRHLENLDAGISGVAHENLNIDRASQIADLDWSAFVTAIGSDTFVIYDDDYAAAKEAKYRGCYNPVDADYLKAYDGGYTAEENGSAVSKSHTIAKIQTGFAANAGVFGSFGGAEASTIANLTLMDFDITADGENANAGALAGTLTNVNVCGVLAYGGSEVIIGGAPHFRNVTASGTNGNAGGLVGSMSGGSVSQSAAALYVRAGGSAGGLIGSAEDVNVSASYSGGHTRMGRYAASTEDTVPAHMNVIGGNAGGLIGDASGNTAIEYCYSTCSAHGTTACGGFIGSAENTVSVAHNYAAGLVAGADEAKLGTFLGNGTLAQGGEGAEINNYYVSGVNGTLDCGAGELAMALERPKEADKANAVPYDTDNGYKYDYFTVRQLGYAGDGAVYLSDHYGDWQDPIEMGANLELINAERLTAKVTIDYDEEQFDRGQMLTLLIWGETSGETAYIRLALQKASGGAESFAAVLRGIPWIAGGDSEAWLETVGAQALALSADKKALTLNLNLDSVTEANGHFAQLFPKFIPGEHIIVAAEGNELSQNEMMAIVNNAEAWTASVSDTASRTLARRANSLFATPKAAGDTTAYIANFRHLENLDARISALGKHNAADKRVEIANAVQIADMNWNLFKASVGGSDTIKINIKPIDGNASEDDCYLPVNPMICGDDASYSAYALSYNGQYTDDEVTTIHRIANVNVDCAGNAGLFGEMAGGGVSNLALVDFNIKGANAGALAGAMTGAAVSNVIAYNTTANTAATVAATGDVGGLVGTMTGGTVKKSAAALVVSGGSAGGLIGAASDGATVTASYSGGHTTNAAYSKEAYNVTGTGNAGGLIGDAGNATIEYCYSTCSAKGATVGGFVGKTNGATIEHCYTTGLVSGTSAEGAFAGTLNGATVTDCQYYEVINERFTKEYPYLKALGDDGTNDEITPFDADTDTYDTFVGAPGGWQSAAAYDKNALDKRFGENKFSLKTVQQLGGISAVDGLFVATHYGDWPAPEDMVVNQ